MHGTWWRKNIFSIYVCEITCPSSYVLWENIPDWPVGPSSAAGELAASPHLGRDATETPLALEAPADMRDLHSPPKHAEINPAVRGQKPLAKQFITNQGKKNTHCVCVPAGHPVGNLRGSFLPGACQDDGCAESPGSQCRCPELETEPSGPRVELAPPSFDSNAAVVPKHILCRFPMSKQVS